MKTLDRYLMREWLLIFFLTLLALSLLTVLWDMYDNLGDFLGWGVPSVAILRYYWQILPAFLPISLPVSFLIATVILLSRWHQNQETTAIQASGISLNRALLPLWIIAFLCSVFYWWTSFFLAPEAQSISKVMTENFRFTHEAQTINESEASGLIGEEKNFGYHNLSEGRLWFFNRFSFYSFTGYGTMISQSRSDGSEEARWVAREAYYDGASGHWVLLRGRHLEFEQESGKVIRNQPFDSWEAIDWKTSPRTMQRASARPKDLTVLEVREILQNHGKEHPQFAALQTRYLGSFSFSMIFPVVLLWVVPLITKGGRRNPMVAVSLSFLLLFVFYFLCGTLFLFGEEAVIPPWLAAWSPIILLIGAALLFRTLKKS